jgi:D-alanyl-D-alanine carboxypeptidase
LRQQGLFDLFGSGVGRDLGYLTLFLPRWLHRVTCCLGLAVLLGAASLTTPTLTGPAIAQTAKKASAAKKPVRRAVRRKVVRMPASPTDPAKDAALVIDGATGKVLYARNEDAARHPASLTKMMTAYLLFEALKANKLTLQTPLAVSANAQRQKPTKLNLRKGQTIPVDDAIRALVIRSANDVAVVVAEALGGTEGNFALQMTAKARQLGMKDTNFHNASGLPDPLQITTATDMAILARRLAYDFPQYYFYFALPGFTYRGTWYATHDNLIGRYDGADGIKTGYTNASGFNLVSSVVRGQNHLVAVVLGGRTAIRRDLEMIRLLDQSFTQIAANPTLVASRTVPWASNGETSPVLTASLGVNAAATGGSLPASLATKPARSTNPFANLLAMTSPAISRIPEEDEDSAERRTASDEDRSILSPVPRQPAVPAPAVTGPIVPAPNTVRPLAARNAPPVPAVRPSPRPSNAAPGSMMVARAALPPPPQPRPSLMAEPQGEGDVDSAPTPTPGRNWTIQIGAYADQALARAQLAAYAEKARDILGEASRIVMAAPGTDGKTIYRARFGLFPESQARDVCSRLTQRGQTCFAAIAQAR